MIARYAIPFFFLMGLVVVPLLLAALCRWLAPKRRWRRYALISALVVWALVLYGHFVGFLQMEVHRYDYASSDLPKAFDNYRIVQFSDAHVGSLTGWHQSFLQRAVDSINALQPDLIVFTGDVQNLHPDELRQQLPILKQLRAKDGVFSILGNHDYPTYLDCSESEKASLVQQTKDLERQCGWRLLLNEYAVIRRGSDSIVIAGMENWGKVKRMPRLGDVKKTLSTPTALNPSPSTFIVMLQHDPSCWRKKILPECHAQLTLSGHTHGGQFSLLGWSPVAITTPEWGGWYTEGERSLYVSTGLGGLIPFRLNEPGEIAVITLKIKHKD